MADISALVPLLGSSSWRERNSHLYPSDESLRWVLHKHRAEFIDAGAIVMIRGRWLAYPEAMTRVIGRLGENAARRR